jgi:hypothetical protein
MEILEFMETHEGSRDLARARGKPRLGAVAPVAGSRTVLISAETYWRAAPGERGIDWPVGPGARLMIDHFLT